MDIIGEIRLWGGTISDARKLEASGWFVCDGGSVNRYDASGAITALFQQIGVIYGGGDNTQTFNLPCFCNRSPMGAALDVPVDGGPAIGIPGSPGDQTPCTTVSGAPTLNGGETVHRLSVDEMPAHDHEVYPHAGYVVGYTGTPGAGSEDPNYPSQVMKSMTRSAGGGLAHNNLHPYLCTTFIIFAGSGTQRVESFP